MVGLIVVLVPDLQKFRDGGEHLYRHDAIHPQSDNQA
jgi:hypothetical protein